MCIAGAGCSSLRGAIAVDNSGIIVGLRRMPGLQRLRIVPSSLVPPIRPLHGEINGQDRLLLLLALLLHRIPPPGLAEALVPEPRRHVSIQGLAHEPIPIGPSTHLAAQRTLALLRIAHRQDATWHHQRPRCHQEGPVPVDADAAARDGAAADPAGGVVPAVSGDVLPAREPREQGGEVPGIVLAVPEVLPAAVRRDGLPVKDEAPTRRPHLHRFPTPQTTSRFDVSAFLKIRHRNQRPPVATLNCGTGTFFLSCFDRSTYTTITIFE